MQMTINERIKALLVHYDMYNNAFSEKVGVNPSVIHNITKGRNAPSYDVLQKIIKAFPEVNPTWLLMDEGKMLKDNNAFQTANDNSIQTIGNLGEEEKEKSSAKITQELGELRKEMDLVRIALQLQTMTIKSLTDAMEQIKEEKSENKESADK